MTEWTDRTIDTLRTLWAEGHSTAVIGRTMGISKNAVVGKAHRLHLPPRPDPIQRAAAPRPPVPQRVGKRATLPPLGVPAVVLPITRLNNQGRRVAATYGGTGPIRTPLQGATLATIASAKPAPAMPVSPALKCQWIEAERPRCATPAQYEAAFCGKPTLIRRNEFGADKPCSYCPEHAGRAFTRHVSFGYAEPKAA